MKLSPDLEARIDEIAQADATRFGHGVSGALRDAIRSLVRDAETSARDAAVDHCADIAHVYEMGAKKRSLDAAGAAWDIGELIREYGKKP